jgi:hypothetical protein
MRIGERNMVFRNKKAMQAEVSGIGKVYTNNQWTLPLPLAGSCRSDNGKAVFD